MIMRKLIFLSLSILVITSMAVYGQPGAEKKKPAEVKGTNASVKSVQINVILGDKKEYNEAISKAFNAVYPEITLNFTVLTGTENERLDKITLMMMSGQELDAVAMNNDDFYDRLVTIGNLEPLNTYITKDKVKLSPIVNIMKKADRNGTFYALPYRNSTWVTYYNKDVFDAAKVPYPTEDWTWDDFKKIAKLLTKGEGQDKVYGACMPDWPQSWSAHAAQAGVPYFNSDGTANINHEAFYKALDMRYQMTMVDKSMPSIADNKMTKAHYAKQFSTGKIGMMTIGEWSIAQIKDNLGGNFTFKYDFQVLPHPKGSVPTTWGTSNWMGVNKNSTAEKKEAAWKLVKFMNGEQGAKVVAELNWIPAMSTEESQNIFKKGLPDFVTNVGVFFRDYQYSAEKPAGKGSSIYYKVLQEESDLALTGGKTLDKALQDAKTRIDKEIANLK